MNKLLKILLTGTGGTTGMTAGSALMSVLMKENFREPEHLGTMVSRLLPFLPKNAKTVAGWGAHYLMGYVFAIVFVELWESGKVKPNFKNALLLGTAAGILGSMIWKGTFKAHPLPPKIRYIDFYLQRVPAHVVYSIFATLTYQMIKSVKNPGDHPN